MSASSEMPSIVSRSGIGRALSTSTRFKAASFRADFSAAAFISAAFMLFDGDEADVDNFYNKCTIILVP